MEVHFHILYEFDFHDLRKYTFVSCLHCLILHACHLDLILSILPDFACLSFSLIIGKMNDNQDRLRHDIVSQHASVRRERARPL